MTVFLYNTIFIYLNVLLYVDFHGAVAYAYGGVFAWQMYGTAENTDESGTPYTVSFMLFSMC